MTDETVAQMKVLKRIINMLSRKINAKQFLLLIGRSGYHVHDGPTHEAKEN